MLVLSTFILTKYSVSTVSYAQVDVQLKEIL